MVLERQRQAGWGREAVESLQFVEPRLVPQRLASKHSLRKMPAVASGAGAGAAALQSCCLLTIPYRARYIVTDRLYPNAIGSRRTWSLVILEQLLWLSISDAAIVTSTANFTKFLIAHCTVPCGRV